MTTPYTADEIQQVAEKVKWAEEAFLTRGQYNDASKNIREITVLRDEDNDEERIGKIVFIDGWIGFLFEGQREP